MVDLSPISRLKHKNDFDQLLGAAFSLVNEGDPLIMSKKLHLKNWCRAFISLFIKEEQQQNTFRRERLHFFLDILSDDECWEASDSVHRVNLNRRTVAKKIVQSHSRTGIPNPLSFDELYRVACSCCLQEDISVLFENYKRNSSLQSDDASQHNRLIVTELRKGRLSEPLTLYWTHFVAGFASDLQKEGKHLYEVGLELVYVPYVPYVEAVEFFWNKIKSLPVNELSDEQKYEILIKTSVRSSGDRIGEYPEVLEYCIRQMPPDMYPEFIERERNTHNNLVSLTVLQENLCFDVFEKLFHCIYVKYYIADSVFYSILQRLAIPDYSENYATQAAKLFMDMWIKEGYDIHRNFVLGEELRGEGTLLASLINKNRMELVWTIMDAENPDYLRVFMTTEKANYIASLLEKRNDPYSLNKFLSYNYAVRPPEQSASHMDVDAESVTPSPTKKQRLD